MSTSTTSKKSALDLIDSRPLARNQKNLVALAIIGNISEFFDIFLIGFVVSVLTKPWNLTGTEAGVILACSGLGTVIGAIMWGRLADKIGRRSSFFWCVLMFVAFTVLSVFTPDHGWVMLAILRIGVGIGVGGLNITSIPYVQEFVPAKRRRYSYHSVFSWALSGKRPWVIIGVPSSHWVRFPSSCLCGFALSPSRQDSYRVMDGKMKLVRLWRGRWRCRLTTLEICRP